MAAVNSSRPLCLSPEGSTLVEVMRMVVCAVVVFAAHTRSVAQAFHIVALTSPTVPSVSIPACFGSSVKKSAVAIIIGLGCVGTVAFPNV